ncbi:MAG: cytochrome c3 family protein [Proteobacteria bacterium]|nr:cytochrome c3 family protein [Pseudomonadota bacterium]MBU1716896.1 cytochrome c3 family protein [Pseudomonadota bacterium]
MTEQTPNQKTISTRIIFNLTVLAFFLMPLTGFTISATAGEISVLAPKSDGEIYSRNPVVHVVLKLTESGDLTKVSMKSADGRSFDPIGKWEKDGNHYVHYKLPLQKGGNKFNIAPVNRELDFRFKPLRSLLNVDFSSTSTYLFHRETTSPKECNICHDNKLPTEAQVDRALYGQLSTTCYSCHSSTVLESKWRHSPSANLFCLSCHQSDKSKEEKVVIPTGRIESLCFRCHVNERAWSSMSHIHGPVGTGDCTICHDPHGERNQYQLWTDGKSKICVACHADKKKYIQTDTPRANIHGILNAQGCVACHSPHATNNRFQLYEPINKLCTSCHGALEGMDYDHPVQKHPLSGPKDPRREGSPFTCTSCHNPHGSTYKYLLIEDIRGGQICLLCHSGGDRGKMKF